MFRTIRNRILDTESEFRGERLRILMVLWDGGGNVPPALSLASELNRQGHDVYVASHERLQEQVEARRLKFLSFQTGYIYDPTERVEDFESSSQAVQKGIIFGTDYYQETIRLLEDVKPNVALVDGMMAFALKAAHDSGVTTVAMWHVLYAHLAGGPFAGFFDPQINMINTFGQPSDHTSYQNMLEASSEVLVFTYRGFDEPTAPVARNVHFVGPLRESFPAQSAPSDRPFVIVALSSAYTNQTTVLNNLAEDLGTLDVDALITLVQLSDDLATPRGDNATLRVGDGQAVARKGQTIRLDGQHR